MTIAHLHVWDKNNKGDAAIVLAVQELLKMRWPKARIQDFSLGLLQGARLEDLRKINQADLVVIGGGGIFYSYWLPFDETLIKAIKAPIILFGVGYIREVDAADLSREAKRSAGLLAQQAKFVGVRDFKTREFLISQDVPAAKIKVIGDPAALLKEKKPNPTLLKKLGLGRADSKIKIGFNLNYSGWLGFGKWETDILKAYEQVAENFKKKFGPDGVSFYYLRHHPGEKAIISKLKIKGLRIVDLAPAEQKYVYGRLDLIIGMMLHVGVMAFGAGTPEISVAYDLRNYSFAEFLGRPELVLSLKDLKKGELSCRARDIFTKRQKYGIVFRQKLREIKDKQERFLSIIKVYV